MTSATARPRAIPAWAIILLFTAALRLPYVGDAHIHVDESFYLLFAERWAHGAMPYVDIWDRKPIGLFIIYRAAMLLGGGNIVGAIIAYQLIALAAVAATALLLARMTRALAGDQAAMAAGLLYPAGLMALQGSGGQATIFTNLAVCYAGWLVFDVWRDRARSVAPLFWAMLMLGAALQIKYTAAFQAAVLGIAALAVLRGRGWTYGQLAGAAIAMAVLGLLPTGLAVAGFAAAGALAPFLHANFETILGKVSAPRSGLPLSLLLLLPVVSLWLWRARPQRPDAAAWVLVALAAGALLAASILGLQSEHNLQPVLLPLVMLAALRAGRAWGTPALTLAISFMIICGIVAKTIDIRNEGSRATSYAIADAIQAVPGDGCIYVVDTLPLLYALSHSCAASAYLFPTHLTRADEIASIGIDAHVELAKVLASRPRVIVVSSPRQDYMAPDANAMIDAALADHYRLGQRFPYAHGEYQLFTLVSPRPLTR